AQGAMEVLPGMVGADGPRDYLLVFQNNAEIRATGGMPGSWAHINAANGKLVMARQGTASQFGQRPTPLPISDAEMEVYNEQLGTYFQDAGFTPDFPRAADLMAARWEEELPGPGLDGVISLDPVAMSYILEGTGPVKVDDRRLTSDNVVDELLNRPYRELEPVAQDALFQDAARAIFEASTGDLEDPVEFVRGLSRAADEGRFLVAAFDDAERERLAGTSVAGELTTDDGTTPHVDIGLNDGTGSKMSYYLRYFTEIRTESCITGTQRLTGSMTLSQSIPADEAAQLPESVTGTGQFGTEQGSQLVLIRIYGPNAGTVEDVRFNGRRIDASTVQLDGRPVATLVALLGRASDVVINWSMQTGPEQSGDVELGMTPSVVPGNNDASIESAC
ncbi:MAG TPA: DUF4012 domain-containing protein, partial [Nocardioides sp.]|nr:DUF4012 domain-containing protein [Nocardioides sp.]